MVLPRSLTSAGTRRGPVPDQLAGWDQAPKRSTPRHRLRWAQFGHSRTLGQPLAGDRQRRTTMVFGGSRRPRRLVRAGSEPTEARKAPRYATGNHSGHSSGTVGGLGNPLTGPKPASFLARPARLERATCRFEGSRRVALYPASPLSAPRDAASERHAWTSDGVEWDGCGHSQGTVCGAQSLYPVGAQSERDGTTRGARPNKARKCRPRSALGQVEILLARRPSGAM
jgi:hypothetical protein